MKDHNRGTPEYQNILDTINDGMHDDSTGDVDRYGLYIARVGTFVYFVDEQGFDVVTDYGDMDTAEYIVARFADDFYRQDRSQTYHGQEGDTPADCF